MADTNIEWADRVWNPVTGCTKVSQGCKNCYAEKVADRFWKTQYPPVSIGPADSPHSGARPRRFTDVQTHADRLLEPLKWRKPVRIFVNSMSDLFHEDVPFEFIDQVFAVTQIALEHTFLVLTKRPARMRDYMVRLAEGTRERGYELWPRQIDAQMRWLTDEIGADKMQLLCERPDFSNGWPFPNIHLGVSVENQQTADERIPLLLQTPAAIRWVSYEPALGPADFRRWLSSPTPTGSTHERADGIECNDLDGRPIGGLDWIVVGGESGPGARRFDLAWARSTIQQCRDAGVPVFVKQVGSVPLDSALPVRNFADALVAVGGTLRDRKGGDMSEWPPDLRVRQLPEVRA